MWEREEREGENWDEMKEKQWCKFSSLPQQVRKSYFIICCLNHFFVLLHDGCRLFMQLVQMCAHNDDAGIRSLCLQVIC